MTDVEELKKVPVETLQGCRVLQQARQDLNQDGLACADCHRPELGGVSMLLPRMQDHCAVCHSHRLGFDESAPDRVLPHGRPDEVIAVINDFYAARAMRGRLAAVVEDQPGLRRRPGRLLRQRDRPVPALARSRKRRRSPRGSSRTCSVAHSVACATRSSRRPRASAATWEVRPVRLTPVWMPKARFDHGAHETMGCMDCHSAQTSKTSEDVLMPPIETCRACHQGEHARAAVPSTCIMCHVYHREDLDPMLPPPAQAAR